MKIEAVRSQPYIQRLICDRCGRQAERDDLDFEIHEFTSIQYRAGYGSIFGDGNRVEVDLCQRCVKDTLGAWIRVTDPLAGFSEEQHGGEFSNESEKDFRARARVNIARSIENEDGVPAEQVIAGLEERLGQARKQIRQRQLIAQSSRPPSSGLFRVGSPVVTNKPLSNLDLEAGAQGSVVRIHDTADLVDVEFVTDEDGTTSVKTVDAQWLNPWKLI